MRFNLSLSESAGFGSLSRLVLGLVNQGCPHALPPLEVSIPGLDIAAQKEAGYEVLKEPHALDAVKVRL